MRFSAWWKKCRPILTNLDWALRHIKPRRNNITIILKGKSLKFLQYMFSVKRYISLLSGVHFQVIKLQRLKLRLDSTVTVLRWSIPPVKHTALAPDELKPVVPDANLDKIDKMKMAHRS